jgi:hypothetical protein
LAFVSSFVALSDDDDDLLTCLIRCITFAEQTQFSEPLPRRPSIWYALAPVVRDPISGVPFCTSDHHRYSFFNLGL